MLIQSYVLTAILKIETVFIISFAVRCNVFSLNKTGLLRSLYVLYVCLNWNLIMHVKVFGSNMDGL